MRAAIFDVDGVLVDVRESYHNAIKLTAEHYLGREVPIEFIKKIKYERAINNDWDVTLAVIRELGGDADYDELVKIFTEKYDLLKEKEKPLLSVNLFETLKKEGIPLGIVTGRPKRDLLWFLSRFGLSDYFACTIDEDDVEDPSLRKPHPYPLKVCMEKLSSNSGIYIGDNTADQKMVRLARELYSLDVLFVHFNKMVDLELEADFTTSEEEELLSFLLQEASRNREGARGYLP